MTKTLLTNRRILVVEDDYFIAGDVQRELEEAGALVLGPAATVGDALSLATGPAVDGAILDINLGGETSFPVAAALEARGVPFVFVTGYNSDDVPGEWSHVQRLEKPMNLPAIARILAECRAS